MSQAPQGCSPWIMYQAWRSLLFLHWPIAPEKLRPLVPPELELDLYDGMAWVTLVPMYMDQLHLRFLPPIPGTSHFPELNLRTYVTHKGSSGVFFFSIDAGAPFGAWVARTFFHLPYVGATMTWQTQGTAIDFGCQRSAHAGLPAAQCQIRYTPKGPLQPSQPGSLTAFLAERYASFSVGMFGLVFQGNLYHTPWQMQDADVVISQNTMLTAMGIDVGDTQPIAHFSPGTDSYMYPILPVSLGK